MKNIIPRDISWLSFNARVLQEAADLTVPLRERIRFLGIHSNNMDEFFRVRVATLKRMIELGGKKANMHLEENPGHIAIEVLTSVNDHFGNVPMARQCAADYRSFDELRTSPNDRYNFHPTLSTTSRSPGSCSK